MDQIHKMDTARGEEGSLQDDPPLHAVVIPQPAHGHITPALQLARKLVRLGFRITFVNTTHGEQMFKSRSSSKALEPQRGIEFVSVSDGLPADFPRYQKFQQFSEALLAMGPVFEEFLAATQRKAAITCVIRDIRFSAVHAAAKKLGIPVAGLATPSAISQQCVCSVGALLAAGLLPLPAPPPPAAPSLHPGTFVLGPPRSAAEAAARQRAPHVPGAAPPLRIQDLPTYLLAHDPERHWFFRVHHDLQSPLLPDCDCLLFNTFCDLEDEALDAMRGPVNSNIFAVGPLVADENPDHPPSWLDGRPPHSVLFISFGSIAAVSAQQMQEFALGLEMSGHAFLWVVRPDTVADAHEEFQTMFAEFAARTCDRALLVPWAPQTAVLAHPAVGAFLTHCGWNSTIESVCSGVPMLAWPRFADQTTNCRYITHVWKIGLALQGLADAEESQGGMLVAKEEVERKVRQVMGPEVDDLRSRSRELAMAARSAVAEGGSSHVALAKFVELAQSWRITTQPS